MYPDTLGVFHNAYYMLDANGTRKWDGTGTGKDIMSVFGNKNALPVTGNWDDDTEIDEIGVYYNGYWFLDMNNNFKYDKTDEKFRFGGSGAYPVVGDWTGDGLDDIGIFKNGYYYLDYDSNHRYDPAVDKLFRWGSSSSLPITGDWDGDGIDDVGSFTNKVFNLDMNGNYRWDQTDKKFSWPYGGIPISGDWNEDCKGEIGVYYNQYFYLDKNGDQKWTRGDLMIKWGKAGAYPVSGVWRIEEAEAEINQIERKSIDTNPVKINLKNLGAIYKK